MENSGLIPMLTHDRVEDLKRMYILFGRVNNGHSEIRAGITSLIKTLGKQINESLGGVTVSSSGNDRPGTASSTSSSSSAAANEMIPPNPVKWVESLLDLRDKFDKLLESCFGRDKAFINEVNAGLGIVMNANMKAPEFLSLFIDDNLKKGVKGVSMSTFSCHVETDTD
jgi:cullin 3